MAAPRGYVAAVLAALAAALALAAGAADGAVLELTPDNFSEVITGSLPAMVEFYAPWCGHCKNLAPEYEKFGEVFSRSDGVIIAKVDADAHRDLASQYEVRGYPTLKWFKAGQGADDMPEEYLGGRSAQDFVDYVNGEIGTSKWLRVESSAVLHLGADDFDSVIMDPRNMALVEFYAPWCGHCKALKPVFEEVAKTFEGDENIIVAAVDADLHRDIAAMYEVSAFPTLKFFGDRDEKLPDTYDGARDGESIVEYVNEMAGTRRVLGGALLPDAGRVPELDALAVTFMESDVREPLLAEAERVAEGLGDSASSARHYLKAMRKVLDVGTGYVDREIARLSGMLASGSVKADKKTLFMTRVNVLRAFAGEAAAPPGGAAAGEDSRGEL